MLKEYKDAIIFLVKYILIYLTLNTAYAFYIQSYVPDADPVTKLVTHHSTAFLSFFDSDIHNKVVQGSVNVPILKGENTVIEVYEGCNSINVMIVFVAFIISFKGPFRLFWKYLLVGLTGIYIINIFRIMGLYGVALHFPETLYFFHKFFFTGILYAVVFAFWYFWVTGVKQWKTKKIAS